MTGLSDAIGREIILRHFPDADPLVVERHALWLSPPLVATLPPYNFVKEGKEVDERIDEFKEAIRMAWRAYQAIPLHVRRGSGIEWAAFARLARTASGEAIHGEKPLAIPPAIKVMRRNLQKADRLGAQAVAADHPAKIALVERVRAAWVDLSGKEPPLKPSDRRPASKGEPVFLEFVEEVILKSGKSWGSEKALAAWRTAETKFGG